jgi:hypothetical protein
MDQSRCEDRVMEFLREAIKWLIGGGALAVATFVGTTAYQWGQLEIEREKNLQAFLDKYVQIATKGSLDERIRFAFYFESLQVADKIGVDFRRYREALQNEVTTGAEVARAEMAAEVAGATTPERTVDLGGETEQERPPQPLPPPIRQQVELTPQQQQQQQQIYYETRKTSVTRLAVPDLERTGIQALLDRNLSLARSSFDEAFAIWPDFHNLAEIRQLLSEHEVALGQGDAAAWRQVYETIVQRFSWGIPGDLFAELRKAAFAA